MDAHIEKEERSQVNLSFHIEKTEKQEQTKLEQNGKMIKDSAEIKWEAELKNNKQNQKMVPWKGQQNWYVD